MADNDDTMAVLEGVIGTVDPQTKVKLHNILHYVYLITSPQNTPLKPPLQWFKDYNQNLVSVGITIGDFDFKICEKPQCLDEFSEKEMCSDNVAAGIQKLLETLDQLHGMYETDLKDDKKERNGVFKYFRCSGGQGDKIIIGVGVCISVDRKCYKVMEKIIFNPDNYHKYGEKMEHYIKSISTDNKEQ